MVVTLTIIDEEYKDRGGVYVIRCLVNGKYYIGSSIRLWARWCQHKTDLTRNCHYSRRLQNAWNKYGAEQFEWYVLEYVDDPSKLDEIEKGHIAFYKSNEREFGFNSKLANGRHSEETLRKMSDAQRGKSPSAEIRQKLREANLGRSCSETTKRKIGDGNRGKTVSEETKQKMRVAARSRKITEEGRRKYSEAFRGKPKTERSEEHRLNLSKALQGRKPSDECVRRSLEAHCGSKHSEETRQKMREAQRLRRLKEKEERMLAGEPVPEITIGDESGWEALV
jgi:group I intron endonuclease